MIAMVVRRIAWTVLVVWFVVTATFAMQALIPADPARTLLGPHATPEAMERVRAAYCLDDGVLPQYGCWIAQVARGDLGHSYRTQREVTDILADRLGPTAQLALAAIALQLLLGIPLGILAAVRRGRWPDRATTVVGLVGQSAPSFVVGTVLMYVLAFRFGWFPISGHGSGVLDRLHHLVLPALTLATLGVAYYAQIVRTELAEALDQEFVRTARAKGLPERTVIRQALRTTLGPLVMLVGIDLGVLLGGAVVTEVVFAWPGLGRETMNAILDGDMPVVAGVVMVSAIAIAVANLVADLACLWLDPRLRDG